MSLACFAITGGCGYIGLRLAENLLKIDQSCTVLLLDIHSPLTDNFDTSRLIYRYCDIRSLKSVEQALINATCVFHLASYGMSGREMLNKTMIYQVNLDGTKNIIETCKKYGIEQLIYCSTYNVVYTGNRELIAVTEDQCSYPHVDSFYDNYSRTKSLAEQFVLQSNSSKFHTVAIRPAAIYGDGETRHLPRILNLVRQGFGFFAIGKENIRCDWVYADNLVHALILAQKSLSKYSGEVYFISDDNPVNNFQFISQLTKGLDYENCFQFYVPTFIMFYLGYLIELIHFIIAKYIYNFSPFLTRAEVLKVGVTHYANINKAKQLLGYEVQVPPDQAMKRCVEWFDKHGYRKTSTKRKSFFNLFLLAFILLICFYFWRILFL